MPHEFITTEIQTAEKQSLGEY